MIRANTVIPCCLAALALLVAAPLEAQYLDPGAGSMIIQIVIALAVGVAASVKLYWRRITHFLTHRTKDGGDS